MFNGLLTFVFRIIVLFHEPGELCINIYEIEDFTNDSTETTLPNLDSDPPSPVKVVKKRIGKSS